MLSTEGTPPQALRKINIATKCSVLVPYYQKIQHLQKKMSKESSNLPKFHLTEINTNDLGVLHIFLFFPHIFF